MKCALGSMGQEDWGKNALQRRIPPSTVTLLAISQDGQGQRAVPAGLLGICEAWVKTIEGESLLLTLK